MVSRVTSLHGLAINLKLSKKKQTIYQEVMSQNLQSHAVLMF